MDSHSLSENKKMHDFHSHIFSIFMLLWVSQHAYPSEKLNMGLLGAVVHDYWDPEEWANEMCESSWNLA